MKLYISTLPQEFESEAEITQTQSELEAQLSKKVNGCPFCFIPITWVNDVPIELNGTVHLTVCHMGRI